MAITDIGLSAHGSSSADSRMRYMVRPADGEKSLYLKWRTASGSSTNVSFDIAVNYRVVPNVTVEGGAISDWATDWSTWVKEIPASSCNPQYVDGGWQWSINLANLLGMISSGNSNLRDMLIPNGIFSFDMRYYDRIEFGFHIKSHYAEGTSPRTDATVIVDYVPEYTVTSVYCDSLDTVKVEYEASSNWRRTDDRFCVESMRLGGEDGVEIAASKPWGSVGNGVAHVPMSALSDLPIGETIYMEIRFNPSYGAIGEEFATAVYDDVCDGGYANPITLHSKVENGALKVSATQKDSGYPVSDVLMKLVGSNNRFDQVTKPIGTAVSWPHVPKGAPITIKAVGVMEGGGTISDVTMLTVTVDPAAPVEVVSLRDPSIKAMAMHDLTISDDLMPESESVKLADRERECTYYGIGGRAAWNLSANLVKGIAGAHDTEAAWRKAATSGDCVLLLSDGTRRVVSFDSIRFGRNHPSFTGISATLREVDA